MNLFSLANFLILNAFLLTLMLEAGTAVLLLAGKGYKERLKRYVMPMWEIGGTFLVFFIVNLEVTYPKLIGVAGYIYILPALAIAALLLFRNAFISYSGYISSEKDEGRYLKVYAAATLLITIITAATLASVLTGAGADIANNTLNITAMFLNAAGITAILGLLIISVIFGYLFYRGDAVMKPVLSAVVFLLLLGIEYHFYPRVLGSMSLLQYMNNSAISGDAALITVVMGSFLSVALAYFIYIVYIKNEQAY